MSEINYDDIYNRLIGYIDAITTTENVNKKDLENLIRKLKQYMSLDTFVIDGDHDDLPF
jgi:hypothetical protein